MELTQRKREILRRVVEEYVASGQPVGSRALVERAGMRVSPSTVRAELAELETLGLLTHPHTSSGRVPTERGYQLYAEELVDTLEGHPGGLGFDLRSMRDEIEDALRATTESLSQATRLLALVSAPSLETACIRHVEVLALQPTTVMVVVITSTGGVTKRVFRLDGPVDPGLVSWASAYLNDELDGVRLGSSAVRRTLASPELSAQERSFLEIVGRALLEIGAEDGPEVFVGGTAGLLEEARAEEVEATLRLLERLERRAAVLELVSEAIEPTRAVVHVGPAVAGGQVHDVALVGAAYGVRSTTLGAVGLIGPLRMDYEKAIRTVRAAAFELSRFVEDVYEEV
ncbi:MAG: heat-inducible transcriptional repressor HrcA [Gaiellaceae bacterium]